MPDILVRDGYLAGRDTLVDIAIDDGEIEDIATEIDAERAVEL